MAGRNRATKPEPIILADNGTELKITPDARSDLYSTFRVGGPADYLARAGTIDEVKLALEWASERDLPVTVFGGGSNMLVGDRGIRGLVLLVRRPGRDVEGGLEIVDETEEDVTIRVPAAAPLTWLGRTACERGWAGMDWGVGLPGNIGGATVNNAGAHGTEMKDHLVGLRIAGEGGQVLEEDRAWLSPTYRRTRLKTLGNPRTLVVVDVTLRLPKSDATALRALADEHAEYRHRTQPTGACAGSIFKNPEGTFSGLVIEETGLKGTRVGGAVVSEKHANFIVNEDGATAKDIVDLMAVVRERVLERTGIELEAEIERVGEW